MTKLGVHMAGSRRYRRSRLAFGLAALTLLAACGSGSAVPDSAADSRSETTAEVAGEATSELAPDCEVYAEYAGYEGALVSLFASGTSLDQQLFEQAWADFTECVGITIDFEVIEEFEVQLPIRIADGNPPDLAVVAGPRLLERLVRGGGPVPAPPATQANVDKYWNPAWKAYGTVDGTFFSAPLGTNMKSLVWYSPKNFAEWGFEVPATWDDLFETSDAMVAAGVKPWCGGIEAGSATGWPAADWLAQVMLRMYGGEAYDRWVEHNLLFASPQVLGAMEVLSSWMRDPAHVNGGFGGPETVATTTVADVGQSILDGSCGMLQMDWRFSAYWKALDASAKVTEDGDVFAFYLPEMSEEFPSPVLVDGTFVVALSDRDETRLVQTYLSSPIFAQSRAAQGGWVSANDAVPQNAFADPIDRLAFELLSRPEITLRYSASDLMPPQVGWNAFRSDMTSWFAGLKGMLQTLEDIDAAWGE